MYIDIECEGDCGDLYAYDTTVHQFLCDRGDGFVELECTDCGNVRTCETTEWIEAVKS